MSFQPIPTVTPDTEPFWLGGERGELRIMRCGQCRVWFHPPSPICPSCLSWEVAAEVASGRAKVAAFTINVQPWAPDMEVPYVLAYVELEEAPDVRLTTQIVDCAPAAVHVGMPVEVTFRQAEDLWLPFFRPVGAQA
jgi:uncharacterized protein